MSDGGTGLIELIQGGGTVAAVLVFVVGLLRGWWVMGPQYQDAETQARFWRDRYLEVVDTIRTANALANRAVSVADTALKASHPAGDD